MVMVGKKTNNRFISIEESLLPYIAEIAKKQDILVDIGEELSNIRNNISKSSTDEVKHQLKLQKVQHMFSLISLIYIMVGYDTDRLSMLGMVKNEHKDQCFDVSREYMKNTHKLMSMNHTYLETLSESVDNDDIEQLVQKTRDTMNMIYPLYQKCLEILKSRE
jgi:hypothetical protein